MDDLLESFGLSISDKDSILALEVEHVGYQLYPVPSEQTENFQSLRTAAAFVYHELLCSDSDSDSEL